MPLAPPVIKIVLLLSFIIKYPPNYVTIYKSHSTSTRRLRRFMDTGRVGDSVHARRLDTLGSKGLHRIVAPGALQSKTPGFRALRTLLIGRVRISPLVEFTRPPPDGYPRRSAT